MKPIIFFPLQTANVTYFQRKIQLSGIFCLSGWLAVQINPDKWSSTVLSWAANLSNFLLKTNICFQSYLTQFFLELEMFQKKVVGKIKIHILCSVKVFRKSCGLWDNVEKYCRAGQATDDNMAHAHGMLGTEGYRHALTAFPLQQWL